MSDNVRPASMERITNEKVLSRKVQIKSEQIGYAGLDEKSEVC